MTRRDQPITPMLTDEEVKQMATRTEIMLGAFAIPLIILIFTFAWVALPA